MSLQHERVDEAALHTIRVFGFALAGALVPVVVFRRAKVFAYSSVFALGVATGVSWKDACAILHKEAPRVAAETEVVEEKD